MRPQPGMTIYDPACGTGGFLLAAHDYISRNYLLDRGQKEFLKLHPSVEGISLTALPGCVS